MRTFLSVFVLSCLLSTGARASGLDLSLSNETVNLEFLAPVRKFTRGDRGGRLASSGLASFGLLYNDLDDIVGTVKLVAVGNLTNTRVPYQLEFGVKGYAGRITENDTDVGALAIGGGIKIQNPGRFNPIDLKIEGFFTPGITTFGNTDSLLEIGARLSLEIVPAAKAFVGYRLLEVEDDDALTLEVDDNINFGINILF